FAAAFFAAALAVATLLRVFFFAAFFFFVLAAITLSGLRWRENLQEMIEEAHLPWRLAGRRGHRRCALLSRRDAFCTVLDRSLGSLFADCAFPCHEYLPLTASPRR